MLCSKCKSVRPPKFKSPKSRGLDEALCTNTQLQRPCHIHPQLSVNQQNRTLFVWLIRGGEQKFHKCIIIPKSACYHSPSLFQFQILNIEPLSKIYSPKIHSPDSMAMIPCSSSLFFLLVSTTIMLSTDSFNSRLFANNFRSITSGPTMFVTNSQPSSVASVDSQGQCAVRCNADQDCLQFNFYTDSKLCEIYSSLGGRNCSSNTGNNIFCSNFRVSALKPLEDHNDMCVQYMFNFIMMYCVYTQHSLN